MAEFRSRTGPTMPEWRRLSDEPPARAYNFRDSGRQQIHISFKPRQYIPDKRCPCFTGLAVEVLATA